MTPQDNLVAAHVFDRELHEVFVRLGEVVLVPFGDDDKALVQPKSFAETQTPEYLRRLAESHVGVVLGPPSGDLYAVLLRTSEAVVAFIRDNPIARKTAVIDWSGHTIYFFRIAGFVPRTTKWNTGEWLGVGQCIPLRLKNQPLTQQTWRTNSAPAQIKFNDLMWSEDVQSIFTPDFVEAHYGRPFFPLRYGRQEPNYVYFAYYFACENDVRFSREMEEFYYFDTEVTAWKVLPNSVLDATVLAFLTELSRKSEFEPLQRRLNVGDRKKLIAELKVVALCQVPGLVNNLKEFVTECVEQHSGSDITIAELYAALGQYCHARHVSKLSVREFQSKITTVIKSVFGVSRSHSIQRPNGNPRGFRNLRLKVSVYETDRVSSSGKGKLPVASDLQRQVR